MNILRNLSTIKKEVEHVPEQAFEDDALNDLYNNWLVIYNNSDRICEIEGIGEDELVYSEYYWFTRFLNRYHGIYGEDSGMDQQQFKILDKLCSLNSDVKWDILEEMEESVEQSGDGSVIDT